MSFRPSSLKGRVRWHRTLRPQHAGLRSRARNRRSAPLWPVVPPKAPETRTAPLKRPSAGDPGRAPPGSAQQPSKGKLLLNPEECGARPATRDPSGQRWGRAANSSFPRAGAAEDLDAAWYRPRPGPRAPGLRSSLLQKVWKKRQRQDPPTVKPKTAGLLSQC